MPYYRSLLHPLPRRRSERNLETHRGGDGGVLSSTVRVYVCLSLGCWNANYFGRSCQNCFGAGAPIKQTKKHTL